MSIEVIRANVAAALAEDVGSGDVSADLVPESAAGTATVISREACVLAGRPWFDETFAALGGARIDWNHADGDEVSAGSELCRIAAPLRTLLTGERTALNFLQLLSGTATTARAYVRALGASRTRILDTRKTIPGLRFAQKYAVRLGGASNHRIGLFDAVLIKENHIAACGGIAPAIERARTLHPGLTVEIEVESLDEFRQAQAAKPDRIMLDELPPDELRIAIAERAPGIELELSGGLSRDDLPSIATLGVDYVSIGALTKHVRAIDLSMRIVGTW